MSSFLSPDNYMQDPLKYIDPSGENGNNNPSLKNIVFRLFFV